MSHRRSLVIVTAILATAAACERPKKRPVVTKGHATTSVCAQNPALPAPPPAPPSSIPPVPAPASAPQPDVALFAAAGLGLVALGDSGFAPPRESKDGLLVPDGDALWIVGSNGVDHLHDGKVDQVASADDMGLVSAAAVAPDHTLWVADYDSVRHYDGAAWSKEDKEVVGSKDTGLQDLVVDDDGRVWVVSPVGVFVRGAAGWQRFSGCDDTRQNESLGALDKAPGAVLLATSGGVYKITSKEITRTGFDSGYRGSPHSVALASDGTLWTTDEDTAEEIKPDGSVRSLRAPFFGLEYISRIVPDARGRVWVLGGGFAVVDGATVTSWPKSSLAELGAGSFDMMILGRGPAKLPPPSKGKLTTSVTGHITAGGKPAKGIKVILCSSPRMSFRGNPCDGQSPKKATSKADGSWRIDGVPLGSYGLAYFRGGWTITGSSDVMAISPSNPVDMGGITYE